MTDTKQADATQRANLGLPDDVIAAALRLVVKHGAMEAERQARAFASWASRGSERRRWWLAVAESIADACSNT